MGGVRYYVFHILVLIEIPNLQEVLKFIYG